LLGLVALLALPHAFLALVFYSFHPGGNLDMPIWTGGLFRLHELHGISWEFFACVIILLRLAVRGKKDPWILRMLLICYCSLFGLGAILEFRGFDIGRVLFQILLLLELISFLLTCAGGYLFLKKAFAAEKQTPADITPVDGARGSGATWSYVRALGFVLLVVPAVSTGMYTAARFAIAELYDRSRGAVDMPEMVRVPSGSFMMGCSPGDANCYEMGRDSGGPHCNTASCVNALRSMKRRGQVIHRIGWWMEFTPEEPAHWVTVNGFWMDTIPVTQAQYKKVMGKNPSQFKGRGRPVDEVDWEDARDYCQKVGKRLPTEAEWEYAARGGTTGARYGELSAIAWYGKTVDRTGTHPVAQKQPNAFGLYDMLGNVREWCADWYAPRYYEESPSDNPQGPPPALAPGDKNFGDGHVVRGAAFDDVPEDVRVSRRAQKGASFIGFRCVRDISDAKSEPPAAATPTPSPEPTPAGPE
jgi:formylglycine-generating enzyme required for sulfatase activity